MKIKIYQINMERDNEGCAFMSMDFVNRKLGLDHPASEIYEQVFDGEIDGKSPEDVFAKFNWDHPEGYRGRSLSVSDVVEIIDGAEVEPGFYFCDSIGFKKVEFDTSRVTVKEDKLTVVLLEPGKLARVEKIDASLAGLQGAVGGSIEAMYPFEEEVCIVCNEEGKILDMPLNRSVRMEGQIVDISAGTFFICDCSGSNFGSLSQEQQQKYLRMFKYPERFLKINGEIAALKYNPNEKGKDR
jgi:hypothetical protein